MDENDAQYWIEKVKDAESRFETYKQANGAAVERVKQFKTNFGVKEASNGEISINFDKLVPALGLEEAMELRKVIDETYSVSGNAGEKPHIKLANA